MGKFKAAFSIGIQHAKEAEANFSDINSLIENANQELKDASNQVLNLEIQHDLVEHENAMSNFNSAMKAMQGIPDTRRVYNALVIYSEVDENRRSLEVCEVKFNEKGYPVRLSYDGNSETCSDREALEEAIVELLSSPRVGKIMAELISKAK